MARIDFLVCHLSGTGHFVRTQLLARAAMARGHEVRVISGGRPLDHIDTRGISVVQLPPLHVSELSFSNLLTSEGVPADDAYMASRARILGQSLTTHAPDVLVTELFPLGRRALADEFLSAIATVRAARPMTRIIASVRDVPEPKPKRMTETADRLRAHYDAVLVHGDADFLPLSSSWPLPDDLSPMIRHVGYVGQDAPVVVPLGNAILVSVGGGILGRDMLPTALAAARLSDCPWHVLVGGADAASHAAALQADAPQNATIEKARPDYPTLVSQAACSISLCGYNTAVELAVRDTPALLIPSDEGGEQEQTIRAQRLATFDGIEMLTTAQATPSTLSAIVHRLAAGPRRAPLPLQIDDGTLAIQAVEQVLGPA